MIGPMEQWLCGQNHGEYCPDWLWAQQRFLEHRCEQRSWSFRQQQAQTAKRAVYSKVWGTWN